MLDIKFIRENPDLIVQGAKNKNLSFDLDLLLKVDSDLRPLQLETEELQAKRNKLSKDIGKAAPNEREAIKGEVQTIKKRLDQLTTEIQEKKNELDRLMLLVPQPARADVPLGRDDRDNKEVKRCGQVHHFDFEPKDHVQLGEFLDIIDIPRGVRLAGSRSYVLKGDGALLEQAILRHTYEKLIVKGYVPLSLPVLVKEEAMVGTGYFPIGREQAYYIEKDELALVGTAEVSLTSYHSGEILSERELPKRYFALSPCFRREAGTYGKDTKGLYRVHQFQKIEQVIICQADPLISEKMHDEILSNAEEVLQDLGLPYRVVYVCTGDLGQGQVRKHDIETWMPSRQAYSETHSCSTFHDFQARRLKLRYRDKEGKTVICHTLNNTAVATPRILIALLECLQEKDGRIRIPECLRKYMGGRTHLGKGV